MSRGRALGPGRLWKRGRFWTLDYRDENGKRRRKTLASQKGTAERLRSEIIHRRDMAKAGLGAEAGQELPIGEILDAYLADLRARVTPAHFKNMSQRLRFVVEQLGPVMVRDLKPAAVLKIRAEAVAMGKSHRTANLLVDRLRAMLRWAVENEVIAKNPIERVKRLSETREHQRYRRRAMSEDEIRRFLQAAREDDYRAELLGAERRIRRVPQLPLWMTLLETGGRWNEVRLATWGDVDLQNAVLVLRAENTKSRKARAIPLRAELVGELRALRSAQEQALGRIPTINDGVFLSATGQRWGKYTTNAMRVFDRTLERAGIDRVNAVGEKLDLHALRHTANTRWARNGVGLDHRQRLMGHSDPKLTAVTYSHLDIDDLRRAIERANPPSLERRTS